MTGTRFEKIVSREWALALVEPWGFKGPILPFCSSLSYFMALNSFAFLGVTVERCSWPPVSFHSGCKFSQRAQELTFLAELWEVGSPESGFTLHWERKATCLQWAGLGEGRWAPALRPGLHAHPGSSPQKAGAQALRSQGMLRLCPAVRREGDAHFQVSL